MAKVEKKPKKAPAQAPKSPPKQKPAKARRKAPSAGPKGSAKPKARAAKAGAKAEAEPKVLPIEVEPGTVEATLEKVRKEIAHWVNKGRYTKVRFKVRGKPVLPDLPIGAVLAVEAASFWWAGLLRVLLVNLGAKALLDVELVSDAIQEVNRGKGLLLGGELDRALEAFEKAIAMDRDCAAAHLNLGIALKLKGLRDRARESLQAAEQLDPNGPSGEEARRILDQMQGISPAVQD